MAWFGPVRMTVIVGCMIAIDMSRLLNAIIGYIRRVSQNSRIRLCSLAVVSEGYGAGLRLPYLRKAQRPGNRYCFVKTFYLISGTYGPTSRNYINQL